MESNRNYKLLIVNHKKTEDHVEYLIRINDLKNNTSFEFYERYSNLKSLHDNLRKEMTSSLSNFPKFPPKKFFGSTDEKFLNQRQTELNCYFEQIFNSNGFSQLPSLKKWIDDAFKKYAKEGSKVKENPIIVNSQINSNSQNEKVVSKKNNQINENNNKTLIDDFNSKLIDLTNYNYDDMREDDYKKTQEEFLKTGIFNEKAIENSKLFKIESGNDSNYDLIGKNYEELIENENIIKQEMEEYLKKTNEELENFYQIENLIVPI